MKKTIVLFLVLWVSPVFALTMFRIQAIQFSGLHQISRATMIAYLPVRVGQTLTPSKSDAILKKLFLTGFFDDVQLAQSNHTLMIRVVERPVIAQVDINGNESIKTAKLKKLLRDLGVVRGHLYNRAMAQAVKSALQEYYQHNAKYNAVVKVIATRQARNRVALAINIKEGIVVQVAAIHIIGAHAFSEQTLIDQMKLTTPGWFTWFTDNDKYSETKLAADLERLQTYYLNRGYIKFSILSHRVEMNIDKTQATINIKIKEGGQYHISGYQITGKIPVDKKMLREKIAIKAGDVFSRQQVIAAEQIISEALGQLGYATVRITAIPSFNDSKHQLALNFHVIPGPVMYVRRIHFHGNDKTEDRVLRRVMRQLEGEVVNLKHIKNSMRNLHMLGYLKDIRQQLVPVPGTDNLMDLNVHLKETWAAQFMFSVGYSTTQRFLVGASLKQKNFLGTGNELNIDFTNSAYQRSYSINYVDPYYTPDGVSHGMSLYYNAYNPGKVRLSASYTYDSYGFNNAYGIPISDTDRFNLSTGFQHIKLLLNNNLPTQVSQFVVRHGTRYNEAQLSMGWSHNSLDRANFPTQGWSNNANALLALPLSRGSLSYYKLNDDFRAYFPLVKSHDWVLMLNGGAVYGNGFDNTESLPFFTHYYGGGIDSVVPVAGFESNSLGPRDSNGIAFGGNIGVYGRGGLILPEFNENIRTMAFINAGNITSTEPGNASLGRLRASAGLTLEWRTFAGTLVFNVASPIVKYRGDQVAPFQFTIGTSF